ncbi:MAG TPA: sulfatase-like hydrolase/transferase [Gemmatimonadaceae bacterium]|nr:sulfatase-like hydrolase/transferase [Gemmatimonadaceae bacterium]
MRLTRTVSDKQTSLLTLVAFGALLAGLGEFATRIVVHLWSSYRDWSFHLNPQAVWMGPLAALPVVILVVCAAWLIARRSPSAELQYRLPLGAVLFVAILQVGTTPARMYAWAVAIFALGAAVQLTRVAFTRQAVAARLIRRSTALLIAISLGGALGLNNWRRVAEARRHAELPAPPANAPNVLLLIMDTVRASALSAYGYERKTSPFLERLASEGIRFDRAIATAPWTLPSHASFFTGRYPHELNLGWSSRLDDRYRTLAEAFSESGFVTGGFVANSYYGPWLFGLGRGFQHYADYSSSVSEILGHSNVNRLLLPVWNRLTKQYHHFGRKNAEEVNAEFLGWLDRRPPSRPFFAFLNYIDAHSPYVPPAPYRSMYLEGEPRTRQVIQGSAKPDSEVTRGLRAAYDGAVTYLDAQLAELFRQLEQRGVANNTIVIVTSDHGESFGEHGFLEHGVSLYLSELHVPLIVRLTGDKHRGCVVRDWVTLRDIPATLTAEAGLNLAEPFPGYSLIDRCSKPEGARLQSSPVLSETVQRSDLSPWYPSSAGSLAAITLHDMRYVRIGSGAEQLFDMAVDSAELHDRSRDPAYAVRLSAMRVALDAVRR